MCSWEVGTLFFVYLKNGTIGNVQNSDSYINIPPHKHIALNVITVVQYSRLCRSSLHLNKENPETFHWVQWAWWPATFRYFVSCNEGKAVTGPQRNLVIYIGGLWTPSSKLIFINWGTSRYRALAPGVDSVCAITTGRIPRNWRLEEDQRNIGRYSFGAGQFCPLTLSSREGDSWKLLAKTCFQDGEFQV
jgi:hypothetical protein